MKNFKKGLLYMAAFLFFTLLIKIIDVKAIGPEDSKVGFALLNKIFAKIIGYHPFWYMLSKIAGVIAFLVAGLYGLLGAIQLFKTKSLKKVDIDIIILGIFYIVVICFYFFFTKVAVNYRPVIFDKGLEPSYPSSHTMLGLCVFLSAAAKEKGSSSRLFFQILAGILVFSRFLSGVHWFTDIVGSLLLSFSLLHFFYWADVRFAKK